MISGDIKNGITTDIADKSVKSKEIVRFKNIGRQESVGLRIRGMWEIKKPWSCFAKCNIYSAENLVSERVPDLIFVMRTKRWNELYGSLSQGGQEASDETIKCNKFLMKTIKLNDLAEQGKKVAGVALTTPLR